MGKLIRTKKVSTVKDRKNLCVRSPAVMSTHLLRHFIRPLKAISRRTITTTASTSLGPTLPPSADSGSSDPNPPITYVPASALPPELDLALSQHVALQQASAHLYLALHAWFGRPDVGLRGMQEFYGREFKENVR